MPIRLRPFLIIFCVLFAVVLGVPYALLSFGVRTSSFKKIAEEKAGEFLKADVRIGSIRVGFLNRIKLSELDIRPDSSRKSYYRIEVEEINFRYSFQKLLKRNFAIPSSVTLKSPRILLNDAGLSYNLIQSFHFAPSAGQVQSSFEFAGGELNLKVPGFEEGLILKDIQGNFTPSGDKKLRGGFSSTLSGAFSGKISVSGEADLATEELVFDFSLIPERASDFSENGIQGRIRIRKDRYVIERIHSSLYGYEFLVKGMLLHPADNPELILESKLTTKDKKTLFSAALRDEQLTGTFESANGALYPFLGKVVRNGMRLDLKDFKLGTAVNGLAWIDLFSRLAALEGESNGRRVDLRFSFREAAKLDFILDHMPVAGLDLVTAGKMRFSGGKMEERKTPWEIQADYETDYFILGTVPFDDLKGDFKINSGGIRKMTGAWGEVFKFSGDVFLERGRREVQLTARTDGFDLRKVKEFVAKPLSKDLGGFLEGKLTIDGSLRLPEIAGQFTIKNGLLGKIDYDRGIIQFRGFPPYLRLTDSRILRGRTTLKLQGAINLSLRNIFHGVSIQTPENLVIWKGLDLNVAEEDDEVDLEINPPVKRMPVFGIKAGQGEPEALRDKTDNNSQDRYITAGPKFKF